MLTSTLGPRFKALHFLTASEGQQVANQIIKLCEDSVKEETTDQSERSNTYYATSLPSKRRKTTSKEPVMDKDALFGPEDKCNTSIPVEVRRYFVDPPVLRSDDPLQWWRKNESRFPHVVKLART